MKKMRTLAVIPCYYEERHVADVVRKASPFVDRVLVVDDGSKDATSARARQAGATVIRHVRNRGKGVALNTGFDYAVREAFDAVVTLDGDDQHDCGEIPAFIEAADDPDVHIVLGCRMADVRVMPWLRRWTNRNTSRVISWLAGQEIRDSQTGYRLIRREVLESVRCVTRNYDAESELLIKACRKGFRVKEIPIRTIYRGGRSHIHPLVDTLRFLRLIAFSL